MAMSPEKIRAKALEPRRLGFGYFKYPDGYPTSVSKYAIEDALWPLVENGTLLIKYNDATINPRIIGYAWAKPPAWEEA